ncbi:MAG: hypothetical protein FWE21_09825 [Defluviitaleaceae bacterium]|nr:hypothetical protein [Defluviitaleaceae bacterium]
MAQENTAVNAMTTMDKLAALKNSIAAHANASADEKIKCFISVGYRHKRAVVYAGVGNTLDTAFKSAQDRALKYIKAEGAEPPWLKADIVVMEKKLFMDDFLSMARWTKKFYFKYGISFDSMYNNAFLQQEVNGGALIKYSIAEKRNENPSTEIAELIGLSRETDSGRNDARINFNNVNHYVRTVRGENPMLSGDDLKEVIIFDTRGYFFDEDQLFEIETEELANHRRKVESLDAPLAKDLITKMSRYLAGTVEESGKFIYGYFACYDKQIATYNVIRHALGTYSMCETYLATKDEALITPIKTSLKYLVDKFAYDVDDMTFIAEFESNSEIKLGALGVAVLAMSKYLEIFGDEKDKYLPIMQRIGNAMLYMQNPATGQFTHVLGHPDLEVIELFRIVYYSGEATFALMCIYAFDKDEKWLKAANKAFDYFIKNNYWKNYDHWIAYAINELTKVSDDDRYFDFGLKNAFSNLNFIEYRITTWATFLELLTASNVMIQNIKAAGKDSLLERYDEEQFERVMKIRAERLLNGIFFPEFAMYFKSPETILYGSFVRHHTFRVRNDDVASHLSGYARYLTDILEVDR